MQGVIKSHQQSSHQESFMLKLSSSRSSPRSISISEINLRPVPELDNIKGELERRSQGPKFPGSIVHRFYMVISRWSLILKKVHLSCFIDMSTFISVLEWDQILNLFVPSNNLVLLCTSTDLQIGQQDDCNIVLDCILAIQKIFWSLGCVKNTKNVKLVKNQFF